jgi:hypothetical protein
VWRSWYAYFPWEDWRRGKPRCLTEIIEPHLEAWTRLSPAHCEARVPREALDRTQRLRIAFASDAAAWDEEKVLERYELLYEAGLAQEAARDGRVTEMRGAPLGGGMMFDHRRILATAISRLRGKMKYRPVVFELMPPSFTLLELQRTVEAISGRRLHKQNFRRLVETAALVEPTGETSTATGGRPAALFRFRREVLQERPAPGLRLGARAS